MCFNTSYKLVLCLLRRLGSLDDGVNAPVAGFLSALTLAIDASSRRQLLTVLCMSRAADTSLRMGEAAGVMPAQEKRDLAIWVICNVILQSCMALNQGLLNTTLKKFY